MNSKSSNTEHYSGMIPMEEIIDLAKKKDAGDMQARQKLITSHLWLVQKNAAYKASSINRVDLYEDLYQEGCYGLVIAVDRYDWKKDVYLATYATHYIRKYMATFLTGNVPVVKLPEKVCFLIYKYEEFILKFISENNRIPTLEESAAFLNVSPKVMSLILKHQNLVYRQQDENETFVRFEDPNPDEYFESLSFEETIKEIFPPNVPINSRKLTSREETILKMRFGFNGKDSMKFKEIGQELGISGELARQIYNSGISKLQEAAEKRGINGIY